MARKGGIIYFQVDGNVFQAKGAFDYSLGRPTKEAIVGHDEVHGYKEMPVAPFIEGEITDSKDLDLAALADTQDATVTLQLANGKTIALRNAWSCNPDGMGGNTEEGAIKVRFEGLSAEEVS